MPRASANRRSVGLLKIRPRKEGSSSVQASQRATQPVEKSHERRNPTVSSVTAAPIKRNDQSPKWGRFSEILPHPILFITSGLHAITRKKCTIRSRRVSRTSSPSRKEASCCEAFSTLGG